MKHYNYDEVEDYNERKPQLKSWRANEQEFGCPFCWDNRKKHNIELFFLDSANNMRICNFCPSCGRDYKEYK